MKSIILLSGGIDSTVCLAEARDMGRECAALVFDYSQANWLNELEAASAVARHYGASIDQVHIDGFFWRGTSFLTGGSADPLVSYVPARNLLLLSHGIACAEARGAEEVWFGANLDDAGFYPDCRFQFVSAVNLVAALGTKSHVRVIAPHLERTKAEVIQRGHNLNAPLALTTSCAERSGRCGVCRGCVARREAYASLRNPLLVDGCEYAA
jgi:7-cyano-7-deazaguanine synthase